ncbi:MAG: acyl-CoA dehydrogenase [Halioglobus sp.]
MHRVRPIHFLSQWQGGRLVDFSLSEEQVLLRDSVEKYVAERCGVDRHRQLVNTELAFDPSAWTQFAELGWLAVPFGEQHGGFDGGPLEIMVMAEALGRGIVREPWLHTVVTCGALLQHAGSDEQQGHAIPGIIDGSTQWAFAFAERGSDFDLLNLATQADADGSAWRLSGKKIAVLNGHCAQRLIVSASTAAGPGLFLVDAEADGVSRESFVAVDGSKGAHITFETVAAELLGESGQGQACIERAINDAIIAIGGEALGAMQSLLQATVEYTGTRNQFGQPISKFQVLQHRMAEMYIKVEETRSLLLNAAIQLAEGSAAATSACAALKVKVADAGRYVSQEAVQLHGGIGMTDELSVGHHYKRLLLLSKLYGDEAFYLTRFSEAAAGAS